ncbi:SDR family oxidoreductase [Alsobacter sp. SYSU M60028]|uniref:SDR family oxidoreductase n=1 Tax=Alsobacter ponti TaxID=2962936 RepID=A0ABT1LAU6_9HYPH|nr:SDR family oxidoreductase [Alsobacter ponti]MCP8938078.1 SDR family oxidoreductase [Alsobacter ponti]
MNLVILGYGYTSQAFARRVRGRFARIVGTVRSPERAAALGGDGVEVRAFDDPSIAAEIEAADALLVSIPPDGEGDVALRRFADALARAPRLRWIAYLSTVGVYGDHGGAWVTESTPPRPTSERSVRRVAAEADWLAFGERAGKTVQVFRLAGIFGPGRNGLVNLAEGSARRVIKPGQVFNRIHVDDIAGVLEAAMERPRAGAIYNVSDDEPAPPQDVVTFAADLLGAAAPPAVPFEEAEMSAMARSFYGENKRVSNALLRGELGYRLLYPTYREAYRALAASGEGQA